MSTNYAHIAPPTRDLAADLPLIEALNSARKAANALDHHAAHDRTYGQVSKALVEALTYAYLGTADGRPFAEWTRARDWAEAVVEETIDNGESIAYSIDVVATHRYFQPGDLAAIVETGRLIAVAEHDALDVVQVEPYGDGASGTWPVALRDLVLLRS